MDSELEKIAYIYGDVCVRKKKQRRKRQKRIIIELLFDYAKNSTLHGLRYIAERGLSLIEKLFWLTTFVASIGLCAFFSYNVYMKWKTSPVIVTVNGRLVSVGTVPFPSVTICPAVTCKASVYNYTEAEEKIRHFRRGDSNESLSEDFKTKYNNIKKLCDLKWYHRIGNKSIYSKSLVKDITEVSLTLRDIFEQCTWYNVKEDCGQLFSKVYTKDGVCYTANILNARDIFTDEIQTDYPYIESSYNHSIEGWSPDTGEYTNYSTHTPYPRRGRVYGSNPDLQIYLRINPENEDATCNSLYSGYKIFLHHPAEFPRSSLYYYAAIPSQISSVAISFNQLNTDISLLNSSIFDYSSEIRQCYFGFERPLRYFKIYTASNCQAECLSNYTYSMCKCVDFYMPHNNSSEICAPAMEYCMRKARDHMADIERGAELGLESAKNACMCRPACDSIEYDAEILKTEFHWAKVRRQLLKTLGIDDTSKVEYSRVDLFFKKPRFVTMQRRELFGIPDLLANIGGLMGLFLGFSFLSLVEIVYFLTLRAGCVLKRDLEEEKRQKMLQNKKN